VSKEVRCVTDLRGDPIDQNRVGQFGVLGGIMTQLEVGEFSVQLAVNWA
jgi:hypothetical protein